MKHRNATNYVKATTVTSISPASSNHGIFVCAARKVRHFCPHPFLSDVSHQGPREYLHQVATFASSPSPPFRVPVISMNHAETEKQRVRGQQDQIISRWLWEDCNPLTSSKWRLASSTLSGGNTKVPPIPVATSPTLPSLSKTSSVPVCVNLSTMFCLSFQLIKILCRPRFDLTLKSSTVFGGSPCVINDSTCLLGRVAL